MTYEDETPLIPREELGGKWVRIVAPENPRENQKYLVPLDGKVGRVVDPHEAIPIKVMIENQVEWIWHDALVLETASTCANCDTVIVGRYDYLCDSCRKD